MDCGFCFMPKLSNSIQLCYTAAFWIGLAIFLPPIHSLKVLCPMLDQISRNRASMLELLSDAPERYPVFLEQRFPHILQRIVALWGKPEMEKYLDGLLQPPKGNALGFPEEALDEIRAIRALHDPVPPAAAPLSDEALPVRETLHAYLRLDDEMYPAMLEAKYPQLIQEILRCLCKPEMDAFLGKLLRPEQQVAHGFCERSMLDIMMLKAAHRAQYSSLQGLGTSVGGEGGQTARDPDHEDHAAQVFDRIQRW